MKHGFFSAVNFSLLIHTVLFALIVASGISQQKAVQPSSKNSAIKSYLYQPVIKANDESTEPKLKTLAKPTPSISNKPLSKQLPENKPVQENTNFPSKPSRPVTVSDHMATISTETKQDVDLKVNKAVKKLDLDKQLQQFRQSLTRKNSQASELSYQSFQPPSVLNKHSMLVPHSSSVTDDGMKKRTNKQNLGSGINISKGDNGVCTITQDLSVYGLSEGSSVQNFGCGETKFDKSFREHMKNVKAKLGK